MGFAILETPKTLARKEVLNCCVGLTIQSPEGSVQRNRQKNAHLCLLQKGAHLHMLKAST